MLAADVLWGLSLAGFAFDAAMLVAWVRRYHRVHQRRANKRFMAGYRAGHRQACRTAVEAASAGPTRTGRHAA